MKWSQEIKQLNQMIKDFKGMRKQFKKLETACQDLKKEVDSMPTFEEQLKTIIKIQGDKLNE